MPDRNQNLVGRVFGHLTVIKQADDSVDSKGVHRRRWLCQCDCGRQTTATTASLNSGAVQSCGHASRANLESGGQHHEAMLTDKVPANNKTGHRNISMTYRGGRWRYRVAVMYDKKQHSGLRDTLEDALAYREELRVKWWPRYKKQG